MKILIRRMLKKLGMRWLIFLITVLIILLGCSFEWVTYWLLQMTIRPAGWAMLIVLPMMIAPPLLYVMLKQFCQLDEEHQRLLDTQQELLSTLAEVKELRGLLAMCAACKQVRNEEGHWEHVDVYLRDHTHAEISHGLCPDCIEDYTKDINT